MQPIFSNIYWSLSCATVTDITYNIHAEPAVYTKNLGSAEQPPLNIFCSRPGYR